MLELKFVRNNVDLVRKNLEKRKDSEKVKWLEDLLAKDQECKKLTMEAERLRARRNAVSREINELKKEEKDVSAKLAEATVIPEKIRMIEDEQHLLEEKILYYLKRLPNILHESVPVGSSEEDNVVLREWDANGRKENAKSHVDIALENNLVNLEDAAEISGARFYYLKNELVLLEQALIQLGLEFLSKKNFTLLSPPTMMRKEPYEGVTDLSDFENVMYKIQDEDLYLIATSEHPIAGMMMKKNIPESTLPLKLAGVSRCFRKEAGAHGKDTKGIFRVHEFTKVEQFVFSTPADSWRIHEELLANAEEFMQMLEIPYRVVNICTADIGSVAAKKYDVEAWMPSQQKYRELVSCSNCTSYQAARLGIKFERKNGEKELLHTLNSTLFASPRILVAILENFQEEGWIRIPAKLAEKSGVKEIKLNVS